MTISVTSPQGTRCTVAASLAVKLKRIGWAVHDGSAGAEVPVSPVQDESGEESAPEAEDYAPTGNASRGAWASYAVSLGFDVDGLKRDEIRDLVDAGK